MKIRIVLFALVAFCATTEAQTPRPTTYDKIQNNTITRNHGLTVKQRDSNTVFATPTLVQSMINLIPPSFDSTQISWWRLTAYQPVGDYVTGTPWASSGFAFKADTSTYVMPWEIARAADWNTAYGWGNHASAGYAQKSDTSGYVMPWETTPWTIAYGWGNHASAGYLTSASLGTPWTSLGYTTATAISESLRVASIGIAPTVGNVAVWRAADSLGSVALGTMAMADSAHIKALIAEKQNTITNLADTSKYVEVGEVVAGSTDTTSWARLDAFTGASVIDTLLWSGMQSYDIVAVSSVSLLALDTLNLWPLSAYPKTDTLLVTRKYGNESGQKYSAIRYAGVEPEAPAGVTLALLDSATYRKPALLVSTKNYSTHPIDLTDGTNRCLFVLASVTNSGATIDSVKTYSGLKFTADTSAGNIFIFHLLNPPVTADSVRVYCGSTNENSIVMLAHFQGVNQTTPVGYFGYAVQGYGGSVSTSIALATGDLGLSVLRAWTGAVTPTSPLTALGTAYEPGASPRTAYGTVTGNGAVTCAYTFSDRVASIIAFPIRAN